jgi:predicted transcriptional regulator
VKKPLLDVVFMSDKRKKVLLLLKDGAKGMEVILNALDTTRQALLPQIRILEENYLVIHQKDTYELTNIGKLLADEMAPLLGTLEMFDNNIDYWGTHKLDFLPSHLLSRISELGRCYLVNPSFSDIYQLNTEFYEHSMKSSSVFRVSTYFHPLYPQLYPALLKNNISIYLIISQDVLDQLRQKREPDFEKLLENELFNLYVYPKKADFLAFAYNDYYLLLRLLKVNGENDHQHILCPSQSAIEWGEELFEYYLKDSIQITEI